MKEEDEKITKEQAERNAKLLTNAAALYETLIGMGVAFGAPVLVALEVTPEFIRLRRVSLLSDHEDVFDTTPKPSISAAHLSKSFDASHNDSPLGRDNYFG